MAKNEGPWIRFFPSDWLGGTRGMSATETGIYITLIMTMYENREPVLRDDARHARLCGTTIPIYRRTLETLVRLGKVVVLDGGLLWQERVSLELQNRHDKTEAARNSANERWGSKDQQNQPKENADALRTQSESMRSADATRAGATTTVTKDSSLRSESGGHWWREFWELYPNKVGKADAEKAFKKALNRVDQLTMMQGLRRYVAKTDDRPWCNPSTWLNQDRWADQPAQQGQRSPPRSARPQSAAELLNQMIEGAESEQSNRTTAPAQQHAITGPR